MAALTKQAVNKLIPDLVKDFQKIYWEAVDALSPEDLNAKLIVLRQLSADMKASFQSLPEDEQKPIKSLLLRTQQQLEELDLTQQRRVGRVAHVAQVALEDGGNGKPRDSFGLFCNSPAFAIALGHLSHRPRQAAEAAIQDIVNACTHGTALMMQQRISGALAEVRLLEETVLSSEEFQKMPEPSQKTILKNLDSIREIVAEETVRKSLNGESPASYSNFDYMKNRIRRRSFEHLQTIFLLFTPGAREQMATELSRGLFILRPTIEQVIISPSLENINDLIANGQYALAAMTALHAYRNDAQDIALDIILNSIAECLLPHLQLKEGEGQSVYPQIDLLVMILGRIKNQSTLNSLFTTMCETFPELYLAINSDILALIRDEADVFSESQAFGLTS